MGARSDFGETFQLEENSLNEWMDDFGRDGGRVQECPSSLSTSGLLRSPLVAIETKCVHAG